MSKTMADDYLLQEVIGQGGMGCVYRGLSPDGQEVAIKKLDCKYVSIPDFKEFFFIEANALKTMNHPSVVKFKGNPFADEKGNLYLPMEYVKGKTIEKVVNEKGPYTESEARSIMCKILDAFSYIHSHSMIHRDIKPSNIIIKPDGDICIIDFGIAKDMKTSTGKTIGRCVGTDGYMSPEQVNGNSIDYRTDIYSLGCLLHYMLTGHHAISKKTNNYETAAVILSQQFPSAKDIRPELSDEIQHIIFKAVDKNMLLRYQTAAEFKNALLGNSSLGKTKTMRCASITVGKGKDCDLVINDEYVSRNHLTINYKVDLASGPILEIVDHSLNGTGVDGFYVHNNSKVIPFEPNKASVHNLPSIMLAGREDCTLDMEEVLSLLNINVGNAEIQTSVTETEQEELPIEDSISWGIAILSVLFPIVGWVMWSQWRNPKPNAAKKAALLAWVGFVVGIILQLFSKL